MATYIGLLRKEQGSDYGVDFPDFPGCVTAGSSLDEARKFAIEALELHIDGLVEDGEEIPAPSSIDQVMGNEENLDGIAFLVDVADRRPRVVRINVTFKQDVLERIDNFTSAKRMTRSGFLEEAALQKIADA